MYAVEGYILKFCEQNMSKLLAFLQFVNIGSIKMKSVFRNEMVYNQTEYEQSVRLTDNDYL